MNRIDREKKVVTQMIAHYCIKHHGDETLCGDCNELLRYAIGRLERCPKGIHKQSCRKCEIHCYSHAMRNRIRTVMRYMGPRMILINPAAALRHMIDEIN
ncbi:MAG: nitrous oxide-stimulated promoter family protein [Paramuribaculum sp.]|nr:nitrous oxide-stimulated promoter family protein [Paramuribaculum sp.]